MQNPSYEINIMENILTAINKLNGVHHVCLYRDNKDMLSTFPDEHQGIESMAQMIEQVFSALQSIDKSHNELYFSVEDKLLAAYLMYDSYIAILLTEKKINFPLIHMGIRSASAKLKRHITLNAAPAPIVPTPVATSASIEVSPKAKAAPAPEPTITPIDPALEPIMDQLLTELINYFGPAAKFVFEDAIIQWETKYVKSRNTILELGEILKEELDTSAEKTAFSQFVTKILR
jgi:predicted regulator of Ras-like GTPase activity (Roadblock/LC7/MglB family)